MYVYPFTNEKNMYIKELCYYLWFSWDFLVGDLSCEAMKKIV